MDNNYSDIQSMLLGLKPFEDEIKPGYLNVEYDNDNISSISWFDEDSVRFTKIFHYNNNELSLITELRESIILKEIFFTNHNSTERFIDYLFGKNFVTDRTYITEIRYNKSKLPVYYEFKSMRDEYIGHITLNYSIDNKLIREAWYQGAKKMLNFNNVTKDYLDE